MIIVAGEALVDLVVQTDAVVEAALGGAPFNTARAAARLGAKVEYVGTLSRDRFGCLLAEQLAADGVGLAWAARTELPTTLALAELDESGAAAYRFYIDGTSAPALAGVVVDRTPDVLFTGGLGLVLEPMATTLTSLVAAARDETLVVIDINCRPGIIAARANYLARIERVLARADIVKVSDDDLRYLAPDVGALEAARQLLDRGPAAILVTAGAQHTSIVTSDGVVEIPVAQTPAAVVDTIGAGDTFGGGLLAWWTSAGLSRGEITVEHLASAVVAAHAAAAVVVTRRGADPPLRSELPDNWG